MAEVVEDFEDDTYAVTITYPVGSAWTRSNTGGGSSTWSLKSPSVSNNGAAEAVVQAPPGALSVTFSYKVSSEANFDIFRFYIGTNATEEFQASGEVAWKTVSYDLGGATSIKFRYSKDGSQVAGSDCVWIDNVKFSDTPPPPKPPDPTSYVASNGPFNSASSGTSYSLGSPSTSLVRQGDLILVFATDVLSTSQLGVVSTISGGDPFTLLGTFDNASSGGTTLRTYCWWRFAGAAAEPANYTITRSATANRGIGGSIALRDATSLLRAAQLGGTTGTPQSPAGLPFGIGELEVRYLCTYNSAVSTRTHNPPSGYTEAIDRGDGIQTYQICYAQLPNLNPTAQLTHTTSGGGSFSVSQTWTVNIGSLLGGSAPRRVGRPFAALSRASRW